MSDENENVGINDDDQAAFEADFFGTTENQIEDKVEETNEHQEEVNEEPVEDGEDSEDDPLATEEDDEDDNEPEEDEKPKGKNRKSAQERINELTAKARQEEREKIAAEQREANLIKRLEELEALVRKEEAPLSDRLPDGAPDYNALNEDGTPKYPLGDVDPKYIADLTRFTIQEEMKVAKEKAEQEAQERAIEEARLELQQNWTERLAKAEETIPEIRENIHGLVDTFGHLDPQYGEYLAATIMSSEVGPELMNYLSQNIGEAQKIVASGPAAATLALGRLEARFLNSTETEKKSNNKRVSSAPPPPEERARGTHGRFTVAPDTDDQSAFEREFFKRN